MSRQYRDGKDVPDEVLATRLAELAIFASKGNWDEFYMRIPAEVDHDADLVMGEAARRLRKLGEE